MNVQEAKERLYSLQKTSAAYSHALGLLFYDGATAAPRGTAANRARSMAVLTEAAYRQETAADTAELLTFLAQRPEALTAREARMVELLQKKTQRMQRIPLEEYVAYRRLGVEANAVWREAKARNDFDAFRPYLERRFAACRRMAELAAPGTDPFDYWLDSNEEGVDTALCDDFFRVVRQRLVPLLQRVNACPRPSLDVLRGCFPPRQQEQLARRLMEVLGLDGDHVGLSTTEHPFTTSLGSHLDGRITTHYYEEDFSYSLFSVIHEGGHALYNTGVDDELVYTALDGGASAGLHESQSRFYENYLGRSRAFCTCVFPIAQACFPQQLKGRTAEEFYRAVNRVEPTLIRTQADELTYPLHILVRYELEKRAMRGELEASEMPAEWDRLYGEYLGVEVPDDRRGILQDCHWADGYMGYFPSYALGNAYGAQFLRKMQETVDVEGCLLRGDLGPINAGNREHIWRFGRSLPPSELFRQAAGAPFDPEVYADWMEEKFTGLYGLS